MLIQSFSSISVSSGFSMLCVSVHEYSAKAKLKICRPDKILVSLFCIVNHTLADIFIADKKSASEHGFGSRQTTKNSDLVGGSLNTFGS